jgi:cytochrome P450
VACLLVSQTMVLCMSCLSSTTPVLCLTLRRWRRLRKAAHLGLHLRAAEEYYPVEEREAAILVKDLLRDPASWDSHIRRSVTYTVLCVIFHSLIPLH